MGENEVEIIKNDFLLYGNNFVVLEDSLDLYNEFKNNIRLLKYYERPDMYINLNDLIIGIESFRFSSYRTNKDGDKSKIEQEMFYKSNEKNFFEDKSKNKLYSHKKISTQKKMQFYEKNFINIFTKHYNKVFEYKNRLKKFSNNIKIYFHIIDETLEKNEIEINNENVLYNFSMNENILRFLKNKADIDGIIFQCNDVNQIKFYFLKLNDKNIELLLNRNRKYFKKELLERNIEIINFLGGF